MGNLEGLLLVKVVADAVVGVEAVVSLNDAAVEEQLDLKCRTILLRLELLLVLLLPKWITAECLLFEVLLLLPLSLLLLLLSL